MQTEEPSGLGAQQHLPPILLGLALFLGLFTFAVGWFSVDTHVEIYEYDPQAEDGKGDKGVVLRGVPVSDARLDLEMTPLSLRSQFRPDDLHGFIESAGRLPSYEEQAPNTGTSMLGVFLLTIVSILSMAAALGTYVWNRRSGRDLGRSVTRFVFLFLSLAGVTLAYVITTVPGNAETDTRQVLDEYTIYLEAVGVPAQDFPPEMITPDVGLFKTWTCCTPPSVFEAEGQQIVVTVTTVSRPSIGAWFTLADMGLAGGALILANRTGVLAPKAPPMAPTEAPSMPPSPRKTA